MIDSSFEVILCYKALPSKEINDSGENFQEQQTSIPLLTLLLAAPLAPQPRTMRRTWCGKSVTSGMIGNWAKQWNVWNGWNCWNRPQDHFELLNLELPQGFERLERGLRCCLARGTVWLAASRFLRDCFSASKKRC
jgi:hypothetical protein